MSFTEYFVAQMQETHPLLRKFTAESLEGKGKFVQTKMGAFFISPMGKFLRIPNKTFPTSSQIFVNEFSFCAYQTPPHFDASLWKDFFEVFPKQATEMIAKINWQRVQHSVTTFEDMTLLSVFDARKFQYVTFPILFPELLPKSMWHSFISKEIDHEYYYTLSEDYLKDSVKHYKKNPFQAVK